MEETEKKAKPAKAKLESERTGNTVPEADPAKRVNHPAIGNYDPRDNVKNAVPPAEPDENDLLD